MLSKNPGNCPAKHDVLSFCQHELGLTTTLAIYFSHLKFQGIGTLECGVKNAGFFTGALLGEECAV
jgi:hypothetical protein